MEETVIKEIIETEEITLKVLILKLKGWYQFLLSKWVTILIFGLFGGILGFFYASSKKSIFTATTVFVLEEGDKGSGLGQYAGLASMAGINLGGEGGGIFQGDNILQLYKSRKMIQKTLLTEVDYNGKKRLLIDQYIEFNKLRKSWKELPAMKNIHFEVDNSSSPQVQYNRLQDSVLGVIVKDIDKNYLKVSKPDPLLSIIKAEVKAPDEFFAKNFNEQIVKNVNDFFVQTKTKKSIENINILQQKTDSVRRVMNGAIYSAAAVADATPNLNVTRQVQRIVPVQRSQFSVEANKSMLAELLKNLELSKISLRKEAPLIQVVDEPVYPLDKEKLGRGKAIVAGGLLAGVFICIILIIRKLFKMILV